MFTSASVVVYNKTMVRRSHFFLSLSPPLSLSLSLSPSPLSLVTQLKNLDFEELQMRLTALDPMMEREIEELRQRYTAKRQPILDAMDAKKRRQQNF